MEKICIRCKERKIICKKLCNRCYYANRRNGITNCEKKNERNYIYKGEGVVSDKNDKWLVDIDDFDKVKDYLWFNNGKGYAKNHKKQYLHKIICKGKYVDHIDRNTFNNHKNNLRPGLHPLNKDRKLGISGYHGVIKSRNKWEARIMRNYKIIRLGCFVNKEDAKNAVESFINK